MFYVNFLFYFGSNKSLIFKYETIAARNKCGDKKFIWNPLPFANEVDAVLFCSKQLIANFIFGKHQSVVFQFAWVRLFSSDDCANLNLKKAQTTNEIIAMNVPAIINNGRSIVLHRQWQSILMITIFK